MHRMHLPSGHGGRRPFRLRMLLPWLVAAWVLTGLYSVRTNEHALVQRCGRALSKLRGPGLHFGLPVGVDVVTRLKLRELKRAPVGRGLLERTLGRPSAPRLEERLTGDRNLILASAVVQYEIRAPRDYLFNVADVPTLVSNVTSASLSSVLSGMNVDDILTVDRLSIQERVRRDAQKALTRYGAGVRLTAVQFEELTAPREVADAFRDVTRAREDRQRVINEADGYAKRILPQTNGEASKILLEAEAQGEETLQKAIGGATRFSMLREEIRGDRSLVFKRLILETMERVLPRLRKIVLEEGAADVVDLSILEEEGKE